MEKTKSPKAKLKQCAIFDFDCTITSKHFFYWYNAPQKFKTMYMCGTEFNSKDKIFTTNDKNKIDIGSGFINENAQNDFINLIFGSKERFDMLEQFFITLQNHNIDLIIATRGLASQVSKLLNQLGLLKYFMRILGAESSLKKTSRGWAERQFTKKTAQSKDVFIYKKILNELGYNKVVYIDDDYSEFYSLKKIREKDKFYYVKLKGSNIYNEKFCNDEKKSDQLFFIATLMKDYGGGITQNEIDNIYKIFKINVDQKGGGADSTYKYKKYKIKYLKMKSIKQFD